MDVKPTIFCSVPRLYNKFYDGFMQKLKQSEPAMAALGAKLKNFRENGEYTHP